MAGMLFETVIQLLLLGGAFLVFRIWWRSRGELVDERALDTARADFARSRGWDYQSAVTGRRIRWTLRGQDEVLGDWHMQFYHTRGMDSGHVPPMLSLVAPAPALTLPAALRVHRDALRDLRSAGQRALRALGQRIADADVRAAEAELAELLAADSVAPAGSDADFLWLSLDESAGRELAADAELNARLDTQRVSMAGHYLHDGEGYRDRAFQLQCGPRAGYRFEAMAPEVDPQLIADVIALAARLAQGHRRRPAPERAPAMLA